MDSFIRYERRQDPLLPRQDFLKRLGNNALFALGIVVVSLAIGMVGYHFSEGLDWLDCFVESAMLLGGMGPVHPPQTDAGKLFAGIFALYAGILVIGTAGIILAPIFHRVLHSFHVEDEDDEKRNKKAPATKSARSARKAG